MDLLDNCVDGVLRQLANGKPRKDKPYDGFWAKITASPKEFSIEDNCGGIPENIAMNSAFRLGRANLELDKDIPTVGMYGIGMKRAMFKIGRRSTVTSRHNGHAYKVEVPPEWLDNDKDWSLKMENAKVDWNYNGTSIVVTELYPNIAEQFSKDHVFLDDL